MGLEVGHLLIIAERVDFKNHDPRKFNTWDIGIAERENYATHDPCSSTQEHIEIQGSRHCSKKRTGRTDGPSHRKTGNPVGCRRDLKEANQLNKASNNELSLDDSGSVNLWLNPDPRLAINAWSTFVDCERRLILLVHSMIAITIDSSSSGKSGEFVTIDYCQEGIR